MVPGFCLVLRQEWMAWAHVVFILHGKQPATGSQSGHTSALDAPLPKVQQLSILCQYGQSRPQHEASDSKLIHGCKSHPFDLVKILN